jgi:hypothetical protein
MNGTPTTQHMKTLPLPAGPKPVEYGLMKQYSESRGTPTKKVVAIKIFSYDCNETPRNLAGVKDTFSVIRLEQGMDATGHLSFLGAGLVGAVAMTMSAKPAEDRTPFEQGMINLATVATIALAGVGSRTLNLTFAQHDFNMIRLDEKTRFIGETSNPNTATEKNILETYTDIERLGRDGETLHMAGSPVMSKGSNHCSVIAVQHSCLMQIVTHRPDSVQLGGKTYDALDNKEKAIVATLLLNLFNESSNRIQSPRMITYSDAGRESISLSEHAQSLSISKRLLPEQLQTRNSLSPLISYSSLCSKVQKTGKTTENILHKHDFAPALERAQKQSAKKLTGKAT